MRIPTMMQGKHHAEMLASQYEHINQLQEKINSGKRLLSSSEDPILSMHIKSMKDYLANIESYKANISMSINRTKVMETSITNSLNSLSRAMELIKAAQTDTSSNADRSNMAAELQGILNGLEAYMNTRDADGTYIFAGTNSNMRPFSNVDGIYEYLGALETANVQVAEDQTVLFSQSGQHVFGDIWQGNGSFIITGGAVPNQGTVESTLGFINDAAAYDRDTYTITFVTNSQGKIGYQITGANQGQVIPPPPATLPDDAPTYESGKTISVNGMSFELKGEPVVGDQLVVSPSHKENILETLRKTIHMLKNPVDSPTAKAEFHQNMEQLAATVQNASKHLTYQLTEIGYQGRLLENIETENTNELTSRKITLAKYEGADQYELISDLSQSMTTLQLTQQSQAKLQEFFDAMMKIIL